MTFVEVSGRFFSNVPNDDVTLFDDVADVVHEEPLTPSTRRPAACSPPSASARTAVRARRACRASSPRPPPSGTPPPAPSSSPPATAPATTTPTAPGRSAAIGGDPFPGGVLDLDARTLLCYATQGVSPAMSVKMVGVGSQYAYIAHDAGQGGTSDGGRTYRLHLPPDVPVKEFWAVTVYDPQTRSMLRTDQALPEVSSQMPGTVINPDTSADVYFGPEPPPATGATGSRPSPARGGSPSCACTPRSSPGSTRPGGRARADRLTDVHLGRAEGADVRWTRPTDDHRHPRIDPDAGQRRDTAGDAEVLRRLPRRGDRPEGLRQPRLPARRAGLPRRAAGGGHVRDARRATGAFGPDNQTVLITESLLDSRTLYIVANTETVYNLAWLDTKDGPLVIEMPPDVLGFIERLLEPLGDRRGQAGPDRGRGRQVPAAPAGLRGRGAGRLLRPAFAHVRQRLVLPGLHGGRRPAAGRREHQGSTSASIRWTVRRTRRRWTSWTSPARTSTRSRRATRRSSSYVATVVHEEPLEAVDPETRGLLASIGIRKDAPFAPDARMQAHPRRGRRRRQRHGARHRSSATRDRECYYYPDGAWKMALHRRRHRVLAGRGARPRRAHVYFCITDQGSARRCR